MVKTGVYIECEYCGKTAYKTQTCYKRNKHHYCSNECAVKARVDATKIIKVCEFCSKEMRLNKSDPKRFCSYECQANWQRTRTGENNPRCTKVWVNCDWCKKLHFVQVADLKRKKFSFCSTACRRIWYSKVWSQNPEWKNISRKRAAKMLSDGKHRNTNTKPQIIVNEMLEEMGIAYVNEYNVKYYSVDNYLPDSNLIIEVMGDYWHCNPTTTGRCNDMQLKNLKRDVKKSNYILKYHGIKILYLWENDLYNNIELCKILTRKYIENAGIMKDYNSFNYCISNDDIVLNDNLIDQYENLRSA
jgi:G:T-mismatch repair DNA endonuclease (very short patch repair protein)